MEDTNNNNSHITYPVHTIPDNTNKVGDIKCKECWFYKEGTCMGFNGPVPGNGCQSFRRTVNG